MKCELCKRQTANPRMFITLIDINGSNKANVCQGCLKKLKNAYRNPDPVSIEIYPVKDEKKG